MIFIPHRGSFQFKFFCMCCDKPAAHMCRVTVPFVGCRSPNISFSSVLLPAGKAAHANKTVRLHIHTHCQQQHQRQQHALACSTLQHTATMAVTWQVSNTPPATVTAAVKNTPRHLRQRAPPSSNPPNCNHAVHMQHRRICLLGPTSAMRESQSTPNFMLDCMLPYPSVSTAHRSDMLDCIHPYHRTCSIGPHQRDAGVTVDAKLQVLVQHALRIAAVAEGHVLEGQHRRRQLVAVCGCSRA